MCFWKAWWLVYWIVIFLGIPPPVVNQVALTFPWAVGISLCSAESSYTRGAQEELYKGHVEELPLDVLPWRVERLAPGCWEDVGTLWWWSVGLRVSVAPVDSPVSFSQSCEVTSLETSYPKASLQDFLRWKNDSMWPESCLALQESTRNLPGNPAWNHGRQRDGWGLFQTWWEALLLCPQLFVWDPTKSSSMRRMYFFLVAGEQMNRLHTGLGLGW